MNQRSMPGKYGCGCGRFKSFQQQYVGQWRNNGESYKLNLAIKQENTTEAPRSSFLINSKLTFTLKAAELSVFYARTFKVLTRCFYKFTFLQ